MAGYRDIEAAIRQRDLESILSLMIDKDTKRPKHGFGSEGPLWDYKSECPKASKKDALAWADIARHILAFHNAAGGVLFFGITDEYIFKGATNRLDGKKFNDQVRRFLGDSFWVDYSREFIETDQVYLGIALVPPRGDTVIRFKADAPADKKGKKLFSKGASAIREGDSSRVLSITEAEEHARTIQAPTVGSEYAVNERHYRIISTDYNRFVNRGNLTGHIEDALCDTRTSVTSLIGIGGVGKTALATWAALRAFEQKSFSYIISITAKDRELTSAGIRALQPTLTSYETLIDSILEVLEFPDSKREPLEKKEIEARSLLEDANALLYVDNLETVDDLRIINFLDELPVGVRAITTSRRSMVRVAVRPVDVGPFDDEEAIQFIRNMSLVSGRPAYVGALSTAECKSIRASCDGIALAIHWVLASASSAAEALSLAETLPSSGRRGEELLEFCFRRVFDSMPGDEKAVLQILSLFQRPSASETLLVGTSLGQTQLSDALGSLVTDSVIQRTFDADRNDYSYSLLPVARRFVYQEVCKAPATEKRIRTRLTDWFEAKDISGSSERLIIREIRQGRTAPESSLLDLAKGAERRDDLASAERLYEDALNRNPRSWRACQAFAEFQRHKKGNTASALRLYEQAAGCAPRRGAERGLIFREWGMLLRDSGLREATDLAIDRLETAVEERPNDSLAIHALAHMHSRKGKWLGVIELAEQLWENQSAKTQKLACDLLINAYKVTTDVIKAAEVKARLKTLESENA